jgi:hypothetical protein
VEKSSDGLAPATDTGPESAALVSFDVSAKRPLSHLKNIPLAPPSDCIFGYSDLNVEFQRFFRTK